MIGAQGKQDVPKSHRAEKHRHSSLSLDTCLTSSVVLLMGSGLPWVVLVRFLTIRSLSEYLASALFLLVVLDPKYKIGRGSLLWIEFRLVPTSSQLVFWSYTAICLVDYAFFKKIMQPSCILKQCICGSSNIHEIFLNFISWSHNQSLARSTCHSGYKKMHPFDRKQQQQSEFSLHMNMPVLNINITTALNWTFTTLHPIWDPSHPTSPSEGEILQQFFKSWENSQKCLSRKKSLLRKFCLVLIVFFFRVQHLLHPFQGFHFGGFTVDRFCLSRRCIVPSL